MTEKLPIESNSSSSSLYFRINGRIFALLAVGSFSSYQRENRTFLRQPGEVAKWVVVNELQPILTVHALGLNCSLGPVKKLIIKCPALNSGKQLGKPSYAEQQKLVDFSRFDRLGCPDSFHLTEGNLTRTRCKFGGIFSY